MFMWLSCFHWNTSLLWGTKQQQEGLIRQWTMESLHMWVILLALSGESVLFLRKYPSLRIYNDSMNKLRNWKKIHFFKNIVFNKKYSVCRLTNSNNCQFLYYIIGLSIVRQILLTNTFYKIKSIHLFFAFVLMFPLYFLLFCLLVVFYFFFYH